MNDLSVNPKRLPPAPVENTGTEVNEHPVSEPACDDASLMQRLSQDDADAMTELVERFGEWLARLIGRLLAWAPDHEDIFQEVLLQVWQKAKTYHGDGSLEGWLRRIATNRCRNHLRWQHTFRHLLGNLFEIKRESDPVAATTTDLPELTTPMQIAMATLPQKDRTILVLYYLEETPTAEIASCLKIKTDSVHSRLHRAREKLKTILTSEVTP